MTSLSPTNLHATPPCKGVQIPSAQRGRGPFAIGDAPLNCRPLVAKGPRPLPACHSRHALVNTQFLALLPTQKSKKLYLYSCSPLLPGEGLEGEGSGPSLSLPSKNLATSLQKLATQLATVEHKATLAPGSARGSLTTPPDMVPRSEEVHQCASQFVAAPGSAEG